MSHLVMPKIECVESSDVYGRFTAEPMEKGFGITLGNSLRRVLLGSLQGTAVTRVKIGGVQHQFSIIPNVKEDVIQFLLNVRALRLRSFTERPGEMTLEVVGKGRVCAADIKPSADFEIVNPELYLATLDSPEATLNVEFNVEQGIGWKQASSGDGLPIGVIPVDAIFTPVRKVNYSIEPSHISYEAEYEKLVLDVWTDATISPAEALRQSAHILAEQFSCFTTFALAPERETEVEPQILIPVGQ